MDPMSSEEITATDADGTMHTVRVEMGADGTLHAHDVMITPDGETHTAEYLMTDEGEVQIVEVDGEPVEEPSGHPSEQIVDAEEDADPAEEFVFEVDDYAPTPVFDEPWT